MSKVKICTKRYLFAFIQTGPSGPVIKLIITVYLFQNLISILHIYKSMIEVGIRI